jgi:hypothetical protein
MVRGGDGGEAGFFTILAVWAVVAAACSSSNGGGRQGTTGIPHNRDPKTLVVAVDAFNADLDPASAHLLSEALI